MSRLIKSVQSLDHHRNGCGGVGFSVVQFRSHVGGKSRNMVAIVYDGDDEEPLAPTGYCAVLDKEMLAAGDARFGENSWYGDEFEAELRRAIEEHYHKGEQPWPKVTSVNG